MNVNEKQTLIEMVQLLEVLSLRLRALEDEWKNAGFASDHRLSEAADDERMFTHEDNKILKSIRSHISDIMTEA